MRHTSCRLSAALLLVSIVLAPALAHAQRRGYDRWLNEDVRWIITPQERTDFLALSTDPQRDHFIVAFWNRRDPTPETSENEFKEEHYRRLAFANTNFAAGKPGWETDRGRIYILYGAPDEINRRVDRRPSVISFSGLPPGSDALADAPSEIWRYRRADGKELDFDFFDNCDCGDYRLRTQPSRRDSLP